MYKPTRTVETGEIIHIPLCSSSFVLKRYKVYQAWNFLFRICHQIAPHVSYSHAERNPNRTSAASNEQGTLDSLLNPRDLARYIEELAKSMKK